MGIQASDVGDLINTTLASFDRLKWSEIATSDQEHHFLPQILKKRKVSFDSGHKIVFDVMVDDNGGARNAGLFDKDQIVIKDVMAQGEIPWRHTTNSYAFDRREFAMNRSPAKIVDLVQTRRAASFLSLSNRIETDGWSKPTSSTDDMTPFGIKYWITKKITGDSDTAQNGEFGGGNPSGFTSGAGNLSSTTYVNWANWTQEYGNVTKDDLVVKMRRAKFKTNFMSPVKTHFTDLKRGSDDYVIYCPYETLRQLETIGEQQNENLGRDIASMDGEILFRRNPVRAVTKLDSDTDNPVYFINWAVFYPVFLSGEYLNEAKATPVPGMRTTIGSHIDLTWNLKCVNRRRLAVLVTAADND